MGKRVFIVSFEDFPRRSAGANYIQYFALALIHSGWDVIVLGQHGEKEDYDEHCYKNIKYVSTPAIRTVKTKFYFNEKFYSTIAKKYSLSNEDYFIFYNSNWFLFRFFINRFSRSNMFFIRVEDRQPYQFKYGKLNPRYILDQMAIYYAQTKMNGVFSISKKLVKQDVARGARSMCLPILADPYEFECKIKKKKNEIVNFIYPGMKVTGYEDDLVTMFEAITSLSSIDLSRTRLHITGASKEKVQAVIGTEMYERLKHNLVIHGFLPYEELVSLYQKSDFLLLIRKMNEVTEANFPSKIPELMSYGVVPICTDIGDYTNDYLSQECAFIIHGNSASDCKNAIHCAINMSEKSYLLMRQKARYLVEKTFYYKHWAEKINAFLEEK